jgi:hypothetical protein
MSQNVRDTGVLEDLPIACRRLPWETSDEYHRLHHFLFSPRPRSIRKAYRRYCEESGIKPKKDPPSSWYKLAREGPSKIRKAKRQMAAIERAGKVHGRVPDWGGLEAAARVGGHLGKYHAKFGQEIGDQADSLVIIQWAFWSLAIDDNGDPIPGAETWEERQSLYWGQIERGEIDPPEGWERTEEGEIVRAGDPGEIT